MEAQRVSTLNTQVRLQQQTLEAAARRQDTAEHECRRQPHRRPEVTTQGIAPRGREVGLTLTEREDVVHPTTPAHGLQTAATPVDRLQATQVDPDLLANLTQVIHRTVELQDNTAESQNRLADTDSVLSAAGQRARNQRHGFLARTKDRHIRRGRE